MTAVGAPRVLVVDDDADLAELVATELRRGGFAACIATDGHAALRLCDTGLRVDAVVTDLQMPGLNGIQLIERLRARRQPLSIVAMTGGNRAWLEAALAAGADSALEKPLEPGALLALLASSLAGW